MKIFCHTPIPRPTGMADPNQVQGARLYTGTFYLFFFLRAELVPVGIQTISVITKIIYIYKRTITGVVSIKIYIHILSPIYIYKNCTFTCTNQSAEPTCSEPLLVCWSSYMRKIVDVLLYYGTYSYAEVPVGSYWFISPKGHIFALISDSYTYTRILIHVLILVTNIYLSNLL